MAGILYQQDPGGFENSVLAVGKVGLALVHVTRKLTRFMC